MKSIIIGALFLICSIAVFNSCYYDNPPEPAPIDPEDVSFSTHILPIFKSTCAEAFCHDGTKKPNLLPEVAYQELIGGGYLNLTFPEESKLYKSVQWEGANPMPPDVKLTDTERLLILIWIQKGAPRD